MLMILYLNSLKFFVMRFVFKSQYHSGQGFEPELKVRLSSSSAKLGKTFCIRFKPNVQKRSQMTPGWISDRPKNIKSMLKKSSEIIGNIRDSFHFRPSELFVLPKIITEINHLLTAEQYALGRRQSKTWKYEKRKTDIGGFNYHFEIGKRCMTRKLSKRRIWK